MTKNKPMSDDQKKTYVCPECGFHYRDEYFKGNPENNVAPKVDFSK